MRRITKLVALLMISAILAAVIAGCSSPDKGDEKVYSYDEAMKELNAFNNQISADEVPARLDIYDSPSASATLADISTFPITVEGSGQINIEIAAATVMGYDAYHVALEAMRKAGSTAPSEILKALPDVAWDGVTGRISFNAVGDVKRSGAFIKRCDTAAGKWAYVTRADAVLPG